MVELQRRIAQAALGADSCRVWPRWPSRTSTPPQLRHGSSVGAAISRIRPRSGLQSHQAPWSSSMWRVPLLPTHTYCVGMFSRVSRVFLKATSIREDPVIVSKQKHSTIYLQWTATLAMIAGAEHLWPRCPPTPATRPTSARARCVLVRSVQ